MLATHVTSQQLVRDALYSRVTEPSQCGEECDRQGERCSEARLGQTGADIEAGEAEREAGKGQE